MSQRGSAEGKKIKSSRRLSEDIPTGCPLFFFCDGLSEDDIKKSVYLVLIRGSQRVQTGVDTCK